MTEHNISTINVHELKILLDNDPQQCVIDVREQHEWNHSHLPAVAHIPKDELISRIGEQTEDKNQPIYLYCQGGVRSYIAAQWLAATGYSKVYSVNGGISEWEAYGYPIIKEL